MQHKDRKIQIMGIVNLTDDSFFADSRCLGPDSDNDLTALDERVGKLLADGADILDIGACSTRPGSDPVGIEAEWSRLRPALAEIRRLHPSVPISIDTYWSEVISRAVSLVGPVIVNDISAGEIDPGMLPLVGRLGLRYVAMHMRGTPKTMQTLTAYHDVTAEVRSYFEDFALRARQHGIEDWILDPGFGFAKTAEQNYELLSRMDELLPIGRPILVGVSRKSMIYKRFGLTPQDVLPETQVLHLAALERGADILRVHDPGPARRTVEIWRSLSL